MRILSFILLHLFCCCCALQAADSAAARRHVLRGTMGTYNAPPRLKGGRVDIPTLLAELKEIKANSYNWLIWHAATDWDDLQLFLPQARKQNIKVWVTVVPPTESAPKYKDALPFRQDYGKWAEEIAQLSRKEKNLVAWSIDDFHYNIKETFAPDAFKVITERARAVNPKLAFIPCLYFRNITPAFWTKYKDYFDGVLFPYRAETGPRNLTDATFVESEVEKIRAVVGPEVPVIVDIYASPHSRHPNESQPPYVREAIERSRGVADGVMIYCHQSKTKNAVKFEIIKEQFAQGLAKDAGKMSRARGGDSSGRGRSRVNSAD